MYINFHVKFSANRANRYMYRKIEKVYKKRLRPKCSDFCLEQLLGSILNNKLRLTNWAHRHRRPHTLCCESGRCTTTPKVHLQKL